MGFKKILAIIVAMVSMNVFADSSGVIIHVTSEFLSSHTGMPLGWKVDPMTYDFDIENETDFPIGVSIKVSSLDYAKHVHLLLSGACGLGMLEPSQSLTCNINPGEHFELSYNTLPLSHLPKTIEGTYTLRKI